MRIVGMDIHRSFAQVAILEDGEIKQQLRVDLVHHRVVEFAKTLSLEDEVVIEATGNSAAVERLLRPYVKRVAIANPRLVRAIAYARVKTDKIDASILAKLHASGFLPEIWVADDDTLGRRRQIAERMGVLEQSRSHQGPYPSDPAHQPDPEVQRASVRQGGQEVAGRPAATRGGASHPGAARPRARTGHGTARRARQGAGAASARRSDGRFG